MHLDEDKLKEKKVEAEKTLKKFTVEKDEQKKLEIYMEHQR